MKNIMVANNDGGGVPKGFLKQLKSISKLDWHYDEASKYFCAEIGSEKEAEFLSMKIIAISFGILNLCFCAYIEDEITIFFYDRLRGYIPIAEK